MLPPDIATTVLIIGGGPTSLSAAIRLHQYRIPVILAGRHPRPCRPGPGWTLTVRSMEIYRRWGLEDRVRAVGLPPVGRGSIDGPRPRACPAPCAVAAPQLSPVSAQQFAAGRLEALLQAEAQWLMPGRILSATEIIELTSGANSIMVSVRCGDGRDQRITADYLIAADGAGDEARDRLGIRMLGFGDPSYGLEAMSETDGPGVVERRMPRFAAHIAEDFRRGPAFLVGDAAHRTSPHGDLDRGLADVDNLAWKLAFVHHGWAGRRLLDSYQQERRAVALASVTGQHRPPGTIAGRPWPHKPAAAALDHYIAGALVPDIRPPEDHELEDGRAPTAPPGHRLPHIRPHGRSSTLDFVDLGWTLLIGPAAAAPPGSGDGRFTVTRLDPGTATSLGVGEQGAILVRPDDHIAWQAQSITGLPAVMEHLSFR